MNMSIRSCLLGLFLLGFASVSGGAEELTLDAENSKIEFVGKKADGSHNGGFKKFTAQAVADMENPSNGQLSVQIEAGSLWSDNPKLTNHLKNPDFFNVRKFPKISFKATDVQPDGEEGKVTIVGTMNLLGKDVEVKIPAAADITDEKITVKAKFTIDRTKWGMTYGEGKVNSDVAVSATLVFVR